MVTILLITFLESAQAARFRYSVTASANVFFGSDTDGRSSSEMLSD